MEKKLLSAILTAAVALQLFAAMGIGAVASGGRWTPPLSIAEPLPEGDLLENGHFNFDSEGTALDNWAPNAQILEVVTDANGGYLKMSNIIFPYAGFDYYPSTTIEPGKYLFTCYLRTANEGEITMNRILFCYADGTHEDSAISTIYTSNEWTKVELTVNLTKQLKYIRVRGGPYLDCIQDYCIDNLSLISADSSVGAYRSEVGDNLGLSNADYAKACFNSMEAARSIRPYDPEAEKQYEINGIIINHDATNFLGQIGRSNYTEKDIINYVLQFEGTHVTDYVINVFSEGQTSYSSDVFPDFAEKYHVTEENGKTVNYKDSPTIKGAYRLRDVLKNDYVALWCEYFPTVGINPWLSFRMNDVHELTSSVVSGVPSVLVGEFYYKNPHLYRVKHHEKLSYMDCALDYQYGETREFILLAINDALGRYDCYGIELDYQREIRLFGIGAEYRGLDILNGFMRDVDDLVKVYEEKYGHEIKIGVRVGSNLQTNYDFGLDVITWAAEDIIDLVIPTGRFESADFDTPVRIWSNIMKPYGVEVAPCIEQNVRTYTWGSQLSTRTFTLSTGFAASAFSQGADKIALYNYFVTGTNLQAEKVSLNSDLYSVEDAPGAWNLLTTIGSYDKLMCVDRRCIPGFNDTTQIWYKEGFSQLPRTANRKGAYETFKVPVGDVPEGAVLTFKMSCDKTDLVNDPPTVYINSEMCTFIGTENCKGGFTADKLLCYDIPKAAHNGGYMIAEIYCGDGGFTIEHVEVYVDVGD